jgi:hypothetical protein
MKHLLFSLLKHEFQYLYLYKLAHLCVSMQAHFCSQSIISTLMNLMSLVNLETRSPKSRIYHTVEVRGNQQHYKKTELPES